MEDLPATKSEVDAGRLSLKQAAEIVRAEEEAPGSESDLLALAGRSGLRDLQQESRRRRWAAADAKDLARGQRAARRFRAWTNGLGNTCGSFELPPVEGAKRPEDVGHVVGGGPVSVGEVRRLARQAFIKSVVHDGTRIDTVVHYGKRKKTPAVLRTALQLGDPPLLQGVSCTRCGRRLGLQWDHVDPIANGGPTSAANFQPLCSGRGGHPHRPPTATLSPCSVRRGERRARGRGGGRCWRWRCRRRPGVRRRSR